VLAGEVYNGLFGVGGWVGRGGGVLPMVAYREVVSVRGGTVCHHLERRRALAQLFYRLVHGGIRDFDRLFFHFQFLIRLEFKVRKHFEAGFARKWLALFEFQAFEVWLTHDFPLVVFHRRLKKTRHQSLRNFTSNVVPKMPVD
jgi:hypothetical protein